MSASNTRSRVEMGRCETDEGIMNVPRDIRFLMLPASPQMKVLGEDSELTVDEFARRMRAEWRRGGWQELDKIDLIFDSISAELRRELKLRDPRQNAEKMLEMLDTIQGDELKLPELMVKFFNTKRFEGESVKDFSERLQDIFGKIENIKRKQKKSQMGDETLRSQFVAQLNNELVQKMLREQVVTNPGLTFLQVRDFAIRWIDTGSSGNRCTNQFHVSAMQRNGGNREEATG